MEKITIHVSYDPDGPSWLRPALDRIQKEAAEKGLDTARCQLSESASGESMPPDTEVLFSAGAMTAAAARAAAPALAWMQITSAGAEKHMKDFPEGLVLTNASGVHAAKGGEYALTAALMLTYQIPKFVEDRSAGRWSPVFGSTLAAKTVTLLGTGAIGCGAARALRPTGCRLIGVNRSQEESPLFDRIASVADLDGVLAGTDILISTLPLTPETKGLIDRRRIALLPADAGIVVLGRARVFDYDAIYDRLDAGTLSGAVLEVFPEEPAPPDDRMWTTPRVIASPHCNVDDHSTYMAQCISIFAENLARYARGEALENRVDPTLGY